MDIQTITTENGHTDQADVPTAGGSSHTFNIAKNQGKWVHVCVNSGQLSTDNCHGSRVIDYKYAME